MKGILWTISVVLVTTIIVCAMTSILGWPEKENRQTAVAFVIAFIALARTYEVCCDSVESCKWKNKK
jgi:Tfp pilus assembly protein FimT